MARTLDDLAAAFIHEPEIVNALDELKQRRKDQTLHRENITPLFQFCIDMGLTANPALTEEEYVALLKGHVEGLRHQLDSLAKRKMPRRKR